MRRRHFVQFAAGTGLSVAAASWAQAAGSVADTSTTDRPVQETTLDRLNRYVETLEMFNNHMHYGSEEASLAWYFPHKVLERSDTASKGLLRGLCRLLELPEGRIETGREDAVLQRYEAWCRNHTQTEYYERLAELTRTSQIVFMTYAGTPEHTQRPTTKLFQYCVYLDHFLFPLDNAEVGLRHPENKSRLAMAEQSMRYELETAKAPLPESFDAYLRFVEAAIERHRATPGIVGGKWGFSYWRTFDVDMVAHETARDIYETTRAHPAQRPGPEAYKRLQDYMVFHVLRLCAERAFPMQIHTGLGAGPGLALADSQPAKLDALLSRPEIEKGRVALLHGGYPFCAELGPMTLNRPNVWLDFSWMTLLLSPTTLAGYLKEWLETAGPWKLLFGVDASGLAQFEGAWCGRRAVAQALAQMVDEEQITEDEARGWASGILRANALRFYEAARSMQGK